MAAGPVRVEAAVRNPDAGDGLKPVANLSTRELVVRVQAGDSVAREALLRRYRPRLERLVHGHVPPASRGLNDTGDIVQNALCRALNRLDKYDYRHEGAFLAWLRTIVRRVMMDQLRLAKRRPTGVTVSAELSSNVPSPLEQAIGVENMAIYERALRELPEHQQQGIILRLEYGMSYPEIAATLKMPSANATRMMVVRATSQLARRMRELGGEP